VRNSAGEAWVTEPDSTSAAADSKTGARRAEAATATKVSATTAATMEATTTTTTTASTSAVASPTSLSEGDRCDAN